MTGVRQDPWANAHRILVEEVKPDLERGLYLHPELYGQPEELGIKMVKVRAAALNAPVAAPAVPTLRELGPRPALPASK